MSHGFEVYYRLPVDLLKEQAIFDLAEQHGAKLDYREEPAGDCSHAEAVILTFVCENERSLTLAISTLEQAGEHVEPIGDYP